MEPTLPSGLLFDFAIKVSPNNQMMTPQVKRYLVPPTVPEKPSTHPVQTLYKYTSNSFSSGFHLYLLFNSQL